MDWRFISGWWSWLKKSKTFRFFININYPTLGKSLKEVFWMTLFALLSLIANIIIAWLSAQSFQEAWRHKIVPGEILAYCLSFLAPSLYLMTKTQGSSYRLPFLHFFSIISLTLYVCSVLLYLIAKNRWVPQINMEAQNSGIYFNLTMSFFVITIILRIYSVYHGRNMTDLLGIRNQQQEDFNSTFSQSIKNRP